MTHTNPDGPDQPQPEIAPPDAPRPDIDPSGTPDEMPQYEQGGDGGDNPSSDGSI